MDNATLQGRLAELDDDEDALDLIYGTIGAMAMLCELRRRGLVDVWRSKLLLSERGQQTYRAA